MPFSGRCKESYDSIEADPHNVTPCDRGSANRALTILALVLGGLAFLMTVSLWYGDGPFAAGAEETVPSLRIDINRAGRKDFEALPGIGAVLAERIVLYRERHGLFDSIKEMARVKGVGPALVGRIGPYVDRRKSGPSVGPVDDELGGGQEGRVEGR